MTFSTRARRHLRPSAALFALLVTAPQGILQAQAGAEAAPANDPDRREWIQLFNGKDLDGWTPKFTRHALGVNLFDTVRVQDGLLQIRYDRWTKFEGEFGHVFYKDPFSYYLLAAEYRFVGEQVPEGPAWARRNNGLMLHSPAPSTMLQDQDFPISIELQLLGGLGDGRPRPTANLCSPGTEVSMNGQQIGSHCVNSTSRTYDGDQWVRVEAIVHGDSAIRHIVNGDTVLTYTSTRIGGGNVAGHDPAQKVDGRPLTSGYIALQSEGHPIEFRKVELRALQRP